MPHRGIWQVNKTHGMSEVREWPSTASYRATKLQSVRVYELAHIVKAVHLVPADLPESEVDPPRYFVNNWVDWESYNTIYDADFLTVDRVEAEASQRRFGSR